MSLFVMRVESRINIARRYITTRNTNVANLNRSDVLIAIRDSGISKHKRITCTINDVKSI